MENKRNKWKFSCYYSVFMKLFSSIITKIVVYILKITYISQHGDYNDAT